MIGGQRNQDTVDIRLPLGLARECVGMIILPLIRERCIERRGDVPEQ